MSLSRFTARVLAVSALSPQPGDTDLITMAGERVFDSRLDALQYTDDDNDIPAIVVYADEDRSNLIATAGAGGPYRRRVTLRVEITIASFQEFVNEKGEPILDPATGKPERVLALPTTDAELEAQLDLFEQQVRWALLGIRGRPATTAFASWVVRCHGIESNPSRDAENNRLATRRLMFDLEIPDDCPPLVYSGGACTPVTTAVTAINEVVEITPDMFPKAPWLADMLTTMQRMPSFAAVINRLAGTGRPSVILPALKRWQATFGAGTGDSPENRLSTLRKF